MKRNIIYFFIILFPAFLIAQEEKDTLASEKLMLSGQLGVGENFNLAETSVRFLKVVSDSRCPSEVTCIWPGEAKVLVGINVGGEYVEKEVVISGGENPLSGLKELKLNFSHLRPYPQSGKPIAPEEYSIRYTASVEVKD